MKYTVRAGDTLSKIARDVLGNMNRWPEIAKLNNITVPYVIEIGQVLQLPAVPKIAAGGALVTTGVQTATGSGSFDDPRVIEKGTTIIATPLPGAGAVPVWVKWLFYGGLAAAASYFLFPPKSTHGRTRKARRR
jgi:hypothetical protein